jgi:hypothetical protein
VSLWERVHINWEGMARVWLQHAAGAGVGEGRWAQAITKAGVK